MSSQSAPQSRIVKLSVHIPTTITISAYICPTESHNEPCDPPWGNGCSIICVMAEFGPATSFPSILSTLSTEGYANALATSLATLLAGTLDTCNTPGKRMSAGDMSYYVSDDLRKALLDLKEVYSPHPDIRWECDGVRVLGTEAELRKTAEKHVEEIKRDTAEYLTPITEAVVSQVCRSKG